MAGDTSLLVVMGGLPGTGKTTVSRALSARLDAVYLRIDTIEQAIRSSGIKGLGAAGYAVANALALDNLRLGRRVVADCVNPVRESRRAWQDVARRSAARLLEIQLVCSDIAEHRRRVEKRTADLPGHVLPRWEDVQRHDFEPWDDGQLVLDTAGHTPSELVELCVVQALA